MRTLGASFALTLSLAMAEATHADPLFETEPTVRDLAKTALCRSPQSRSASAALEAADAVVDIARSARRPTLDLESSAGYLDQRNRFDRAFDSDVDGTFTDVSLLARQQLYDGGETRSRTAAAEAQQQAALARRDSVQQSILFRAFEATVDLARSREVLDLNTASQAILEQQLSYTRARVEAGESARMDQSRTDAALLVSRSNVVLADARLSADRNTARLVVGADAAGAPSDGLARSLTRIGDRLQLQDGRADTLEDHPRVREARWSAEAADRRTDAVRRSFRPRADANARLNRLTGPVNFGDFNDTSQSYTSQAFVSVRVPLYSGGLKRARIAEASALASGFDYDLAEVRNEVALAHSNALDLYAATKEARDRVAEAVEQAEAVIVAARSASRSGRISTIDLLATEDLLLDLRVQQTEAEADVARAALSLMRAAGLLTMDAVLGRGVETYGTELNCGSESPPRLLSSDTRADGAFIGPPVAIADASQP